MDYASNQINQKYSRFSWMLPLRRISLTPCKWWRPHSSFPSRTQCTRNTAVLPACATPRVRPHSITHGLHRNIASPIHMDTVERTTVASHRRAQEVTVPPPLDDGVWMICQFKMSILRMSLWGTQIRRWKWVLVPLMPVSTEVLGTVVARQHRLTETITTSNVSNKGKFKKSWSVVQNVSLARRIYFPLFNHMFNMIMGSLNMFGVNALAASM